MREARGKTPRYRDPCDADKEMLDNIKSDITAEDYFRAKFVIEEKDRVLAVCDALVKNDFETVGRCMYETHHGLSKDYEVSCEELDYLNDIAKECGVTGSRIMGGGFGGCTINLVKNELPCPASSPRPKNSSTRNTATNQKVYEVIISDGAHKSRRITLSYLSFRSCAKAGNFISHLTSKTLNHNYTNEQKKDTVLVSGGAGSSVLTLQ